MGNISLAIILGYVHTIPDRFSYRQERHLVQYEQQQHRTGTRGWPRGFGELNPSPHSRTFAFVLVGFSPRSYLFTSVTVRVPAHTVWHSSYTMRDAPLLGSVRGNFAPLKNSRRHHRTYL